MSDFVTRLALRALGRTPSLEPLIAPRFAPGPGLAAGEAPAHGDDLDGEDLDGGLSERVVERAPAAAAEAERTSSAASTVPRSTADRAPAPAERAHLPRESVPREGSLGESEPRGERATQARPHGVPPRESRPDEPQQHGSSPQASVGSARPTPVVTRPRPSAGEESSGGRMAPISRPAPDRPGERHTEGEPEASVPGGPEGPVQPAARRATAEAAPAIQGRGLPPARAGALLSSPVEMSTLRGEPPRATRAKLERPESVPPGATPSREHGAATDARPGHAPDRVEGRQQIEGRPQNPPASGEREPRREAPPAREESRETPAVRVSSERRSAEPYERALVEESASRGASPESAPQAPTVRVEIGRIEVRARHSEVPRPASRGREPPLSLGAYLDRRGERDP